MSSTGTAEIHNHTQEENQPEPEIQEDLSNYKFLIRTVQSSAIRTLAKH